MIICKNCVETFEMFGITRIIIAGTGRLCQLCLCADADYSVPDDEFRDKCQTAAIYVTLIAGVTEKNINSPIVEHTLNDVFSGKLSPLSGLFSIIIKQDSVIQHMAEAISEDEQEEKPAEPGSKIIISS